MGGTEKQVPVVLAQSDGNCSVVTGSNPNSTKQRVGALEHLSVEKERPRRLPGACWLVSWKANSGKASVAMTTTA